MLVFYPVKCFYTPKGIQYSIKWGIHLKHIRKEFSLHYLKCILSIHSNILTRNLYQLPLFHYQTLVVTRYHRRTNTFQVIKHKLVQGRLCLCHFVIFCRHRTRYFCYRAKNRIYVQMCDMQIGKENRTTDKKIAKSRTSFVTSRCFHVRILWHTSGYSCYWQHTENWRHLCEKVGKTEVKNA